MRLKNRLNGRHRGHAGFSLVEVMVAVLILGTLIVSLFGAFSSGLGTTQAARENMRATQILVQKMETIRLFTWSQGVQNNLASTNFISYYDPSVANNMGTLYSGVYTPAPSPAGLPADYRDKMRRVTVTVFWTNYSARRVPVVQQRQMETLVARYGMQNYVY